MPALELPSILMIVCVSLFTAIAAFTDLRTRKIPNKLTIPAFLLGVAYQLAFHHEFPELYDAAKGFVIGFGALFVLWLIGGGGGGDAKLMGAVSVWLGFKLTFAVLILSTVFVGIGTCAVIVYSTFKRGAARTKDKYVATTFGGKKDGSSKVEAIPDRQKRRIMTYALPVALATWMVLAWVHFIKPARDARHVQGAAPAAQFDLSQNAG